jgi:phosphoglycolate phosphatase
MRRFIGPPLREALGEILRTDDAVLIEEAVRLYRERFSSTGLFENAVYPGVPDALAQLRGEGFVLRVVTSKPKVYADRIVDHFQLREFFPHVYGAELSGGRSTKAELLAYFLQSEPSDPARACMIGDRSHDIVGARAHGISSVGVTWGYGTRDELRAAGADRVIDEVGELLGAARASSAKQSCGKS